MEESRLSHFLKKNIVIVGMLSIHTEVHVEQFRKDLFINTFIQDGDMQRYKLSEEVNSILLQESHKVHTP